MNGVFRLILPVLMLSAVLTLLPACGGGGARSVQNTTTTTKGQELMDLKKAYDSGIISDREYRDQREAILDRE